MTLISKAEQRIIRQSDLKRQNYLSLPGITDKLLALVHTVLDQADELFALSSLNLSAGDKEKLIEINDYIKDLYRQRLKGKQTGISLQLKCWYEQRQSLLQSAMTAGQKTVLKGLNSQLRLVLDAVAHNRANIKLNDVFTHLHQELGKQQAMAGIKSGHASYLGAQPALLTVNLAS